MGNQIDLGESRSLYIPTVSLHWNVVLQQRPGFGATVDLSLLLSFPALQPPIHRSSPAVASLSPDSSGSVCGSKASSSAAGPSAVPTRDSQPLPIPPSAPPSLFCRSVAACPALAWVAAFQEQGRLTNESHTCGCNPWLHRTHPAARLGPCVPLCHTAHTLPANTPISSRFPPNSPLSFHLSRVTSYVSRRPPLRLHFAWRDTPDCRWLRLRVTF